MGPGVGFRQRRPARRLAAHGVDPDGGEPDAGGRGRGLGEHGRGIQGGHRPGGRGHHQQCLDLLQAQSETPGQRARRRRDDHQQAQPIGDGVQIEDRLREGRRRPELSDHIADAEQRPGRHGPGELGSQRSFQHGQGEQRPQRRRRVEGEQPHHRERNHRVHTELGQTPGVRETPSQPGASTHVEEIDRDERGDHSGADPPGEGHRCAGWGGVQRELDTGEDHAEPAHHDQDRVRTRAGRRCPAGHAHQGVSRGLRAGHPGSCGVSAGTAPDLSHRGQHLHLRGSRGVSVISGRMPTRTRPTGHAKREQAFEHLRRTENRLPQPRLRPGSFSRVPDAIYRPEGQEIGTAAQLLAVFDAYGVRNALVV